MNATGYANWAGSWKHGTGMLATQSETLKNQLYSFSSRFEGATGASPEELLATAHAGCFNQALANNFGMKDLVADSIETSVVVDLGYGDDGHPAVKGVHITTRAKVPTIGQELFEYCAERARANCTLSKILNCKISLDASLVS